MGIIIKKAKHYYTRFPIILISLIFLGILPFIVGFIGTWITEASTGESCNEGNCYWAVIPWVGIFVTFPISGILIIILFVIVLVDSVKMKRN